MLMKSNAIQAELILGSANFTARNLKNYNLETNLRVVGQMQDPVFQDAQHYFNTAWSNLEGKNMSVDYAVYAGMSRSEIYAVSLYGVEWFIDILTLSFWSDVIFSKIPLVSRGIFRNDNEALKIIF